MTIEDLFDAIPNSEGVDVVLVNSLFVRIQNFQKMTEQAKLEPPYLTETSREGYDRHIKNPFWDVYRNEASGIMQTMSELNLTPKTRKTLGEKMNRPNLG